MASATGTTTVCVERALPVVADHCYTVGVTWGYGGRARVSVMFSAGVSRSLGGENFEGDAGVASGEFCTDAGGTATLQVMALSPERVTLMNERLEYAVAVAARAETPDETAARRERDAARAEAATAQMEENIFQAELRKGGEAFARGCQRCRALGAGQFETCAQALGMDERGRVLCQPPVR
jgi:hypothetical protein